MMNSIIYKENDLNLNSACLLAKELVTFYRTHQDKINSLSLRELQCVEDLLIIYLNKTLCNCFFIDCQYQSNIKDIWEHSLKCKYNPHYQVFMKEMEQNEVSLIKVKEKLEEVSNLKPFQVDYYTSLSDSYLKENVYIEAKSNWNLNYFTKFKNNQNWKLKDNQFGYETYIKQEENNLLGIKTKQIISCGYKKIFYFLDKPESILKFNKFAIDAYTIRQINTNTRLVYTRMKPGFGTTDFISLQQVYMKKDITTLILRSSLNESESPHKYTPSIEKFVQIKRGYCHVDAFEITKVDQTTTELNHYIYYDYKLDKEYEEVVRCIQEQSIKFIKIIKSLLEKETIEEFENK